jgi:phosphatidylserine/phosphatidylglycerophosphate/cardiolipin synthase-like enzyme
LFHQIDRIHFISNWSPWTETKKQIARAGHPAEEASVKSEIDFINEARRYVLVDAATLAADFKRIYTEGRRDQNKEDLDVMDSETLKMANDGGIVKYEILVRAIRAAGPREGE